jgi:drug/metabolite transporter (DMT)-like permease
MSQPTPTQGRLLAAAAAVLWSLSGACVKVLTRDTPLGLNDPLPSELVIALYRVFFAGLVLVPTLRRRDVTFQPRMLAMALCFAVMNGLFISAMARGTAASAIILQYTAPLWMYLANVLWLKEPADRRGTVALFIAMAGVAIIVADAWRDVTVVALALGSGVTYAGVLLFLRSLRHASPGWLTVLNHLVAAAALSPVLFFNPLPTAGQTLFLLVFGAVQMGLPYWLMSRALRSVTAQEAGTIGLLEPLLNPVWAYLVAGDEPGITTLVGGAFVLAALAWQYWPRRAPAAAPPQPSKFA